MAMRHVVVDIKVQLVPRDILVSSGQEVDTCRTVEECKQSTYA